MTRHLSCKTKSPCQSNQRLHTDVTASNTGPYTTPASFLSWIPDEISHELQYGLLNLAFHPTFCETNQTNKVAIIEQRPSQVIHTTDPVAPKPDRNVSSVPAHVSSERLQSQAIRCFGKTIFRVEVTRSAKRIANYKTSKSRLRAGALKKGEVAATKTPCVGGDNDTVRSSTIVDKMVDKDMTKCRSTDEPVTGTLDSVAQTLANH